MENHNDTLVALGRLEGKLDVLVTMHSQQATRIESLEGRTNKIEIDIAGISATKAQSRDWMATGISLIALLATIGAVLTPIIFGGA